MKPINATDLNKAYQIFLFNFLGLVGLSLVALYFYFAAVQAEFEILTDKVKSTEQLMSKRRNINNYFQKIYLNFNQLSRYTSSNEDMNNQVILLDDIKMSNSKIEELIKGEDEQRSSFQLYQKMTKDIVLMASIQDSLSSTRFQIENLRAQLNSCATTNKNAIRKITNARFR